MKIDFDNIAEQFSGLDPDNIGNWPILVRALIIIAVVAAVLAAGYYFDTQKQIEELARAEQQEVSLRKDFETKQAKAVNLEAYREQMKDMEESFGTMLRQLPSKTEVADLLVDITQTGLASGLDFDLFEPGTEAPREFYAELPISIKVKGDYHQLGEFVSGVAALPRIVTLHNIEVTPERDDGLAMSATAKTYRYLNDSELAGSNSKRKSKRR
ncbi:MAG: type 4a pilus biogenesis protein PilO [Pseudomonadota bacterium]